MKKNWINIAAALVLMAGSAAANAAPASANPVVAEKTDNTVTPYLRKEGERVFVNYLNLEGSSVVVKVMDEENRVLYFERFSSAPVVEKAINFGRAVKGVYKVEVMVSDGNRTISESLKVVR